MAVGFNFGYICLNLPFYLLSLQKMIEFHKDNYMLSENLMHESHRPHKFCFLCFFVLLEHVVLS